LALFDIFGVTRMVDKAMTDDRAAATAATASKMDDTAYKQALVKAAMSNAHLQRARAKHAIQQADTVLLAREKRLLKAREQREALEQLAAAQRSKDQSQATAMQREIDHTISHAVRDAEQDLARNTPKRPSKHTVQQWAAAATAAARGDTPALHAFCNKQGDSRGCVKALRRHGASKKPCDPEMPGYFACLGVQSTGGTLG